ncbi:MAG: large subunit ribosomal protein L19 [Parcubacteria group bacterium Athens0714_16]|nr:MAG: large subunit ribosomal protein L19 [Parcubacteria group bacterium Athens0714_16]
MIEFNMAQRSGKVLALQSGDVVRVFRKIKEGEKERTQVFEGMIIAVKGGQSSSPIITVRKVSSGVGVELIIPANSPMIEKIELIKRAKVRRSKLYYVREKTAKSLRFKYTDAKDIKTSKQEEVKNEVVVEEKIEEESKEVEKEIAEVKEEKKVEKTEEAKEKKAPAEEKKEEAEKKEKEDQKENK